MSPQARREQVAFVREPATRRSNRLFICVGTLIGQRGIAPPGTWRKRARTSCSKQAWSLLSIIFSLTIKASAATAEVVEVKYRGPVDLKTFDCRWIDRSSLVFRLCYDARKQYAVVNLGGTYYRYCEVPAPVISAWRNAESMGRFYNANVKGRFDCRATRVPSYTQ